MGVYIVHEHDETTLFIEDAEGVFRAGLRFCGPLHNFSHGPLLPTGPSPPAAGPPPCLILYLYFYNVIKILQFNDIFMTTPVSQETLEEI